MCVRPHQGQIWLVLAWEAGRGLTVGAPADLVVLDETDPDQIIVTQPERLKVFKAGRLVAENSRHSTLHGIHSA